MAAGGDETHGNHRSPDVPGGAPEQPDARERIIRAAYDYIVHGDYPTVTLDDVCRRAHVDPDTLHRCFATRDRLTEAVYDWQSAQGAWLYAKLTEVLAGRSADMSTWIGAAVDYWEDHRDFLYPIHRIGTLSPEVSLYMVSDLQDSLDQVVNSLPDLSERRRVDLKMTLQMLFMQLDAVCFDAFAREAPIDRENVVRILSEIWESTLMP